MGQKTVQRSGSSFPSILDLSVIVSCFNQADLLEPAIRECQQQVGALVGAFEILVINDGSIDGSVRILDRLRKEFPHVRVTHQLHSGRSKALRRAYDLARGQYVFQFDLRETAILGEFPRFWEHRERYALALGYHGLPGSRMRRALHWTLKRWIQLWFGAELVEADSPNRLFRRSDITQYLGKISPECDEIDLAFSLAAYQETPRKILELELPNQVSPATLRETTAKLVYYFIEIPLIRLRRHKRSLPLPIPESA